MTSVVIFAIAAIVLFVLLLISAKRLQSHGTSEELLRELCNLKLPTERQSAFAIASQALDAKDRLFLESRIRRDVRERALRARREYALEYLIVLRRDFRNLNRVARLLAGASHTATAGRELRRLRYALAFESSWLLAWVKVRSGAEPIRQIQSLAGEIGALASKLESAIAAWQESTLSERSEAIRA